MTTPTTVPLRQDILDSTKGVLRVLCWLLLTLAIVAFVLWALVTLWIVVNGFVALAVEGLALIAGFIAVGVVERRRARARAVAYEVEAQKQKAKTEAMLQKIDSDHGQWMANLQERPYEYKGVTYQPVPAAE